MRRRLVAATVVVALCLCGAGQAFAQKPDNAVEQSIEFNPMKDPSVQKSMREIELKFAYDAAAKVAQHGPADIALNDQATLKLPTGYVFVPKKEAALVMGALGNPVSVAFLGMITSENQSDNWFITVDFNKVGYVRDNEAKTWNVDQLLNWVRNSAEAGNKTSIENGLPPIEVKGWAEAPAYDPATHRLIWAAVADEKDAPADSDPAINYRTFILARDGYLFLNLIANHKALDADKKHSQQILSAIVFNEGKRYEDFVAGKDKVANFGLSTLVAPPTSSLDILTNSGSFIGKNGNLLILFAVVALIVVVWRIRTSRAA